MTPQTKVILLKLGLWGRPPHYVGLRFVPVLWPGAVRDCAARGSSGENLEWARHLPDGTLVPCQVCQRRNLLARNIKYLCRQAQLNTAAASFGR